MVHPLREKVQAVGRRIGRLVLLHSLAWLVGSVLLVAFFLGLVDYLLRLQDFGVRLICWAGLLSVLAAGFYYLLYPAITFRPQDLEIAQRIERYYPQLADRLSSALAFLEQAENDPTAGSAALRRAVVAEAEAAVEALDLNSAIDPRRPWRVALAAGAIFTLVGLVCLLDLSSARLAAQRLLSPWSDLAWPRRNELAFQDPPERLAAGDDFEVALIDKKRKEGQGLPVVKIQYWFDGDREDQIQTKEMRPLNDTLVHRLENVTRQFQYRAFGGDDNTMGWQTREVAEPPRIAALKLTVVPPKYTQWKDIEESSKQIRVLEGSHLEIAANANKPLKAALVRIEGETGQSELVGKLSADGRNFTIAGTSDKPWTVSKSATMTLEIVDQDDVKGGGDWRWEMIVLPDRPPTVSLEKPAANTFVTNKAIVPVRALVKDDLGVASVELHYVRSDHSDQGEQSIVLVPATGNSPSKQIAQLADQADRNESLVFVFPEDLKRSKNEPLGWDLSKLAGLQPGISLMIHVEATDHKPQVGRCLSQRLMIISEEELKDRLAQRQATILAQLADVLKAERASRAQTKSLQIQLAEAGALGKSDVDQLQSAELNQREVQRLLLDPATGVESQVAALLADLSSNRVDSDETKRRMTALQKTIRDLGTGPLPNAQRDLIEALKSARAALPASDASAGATDQASTSRPLTAAGKHQDQVIATLEQVLGDLSQWDSYRRFSREISQLRREQDEIRKQTDPLRLKTLGKDAQDLTAQERADVKRLAELQYELGRQFDKIQSRMEQARQKLQESEPLAAETMGDALDAARRLALSGQMRESGGSLEKNQVGQASRMQEEIGRGLDEMLDVLANRREHELGRLVKKLREAADELAQLREQQQGLQKKQEAAAKGASSATQKKAELQRLSKEQQQLAEQVNRVARRLKRLQSEAASDAAASAGTQLGKAAEAGEKEQTAQALEDALQGEKKLAEAQQQLEQDLRQAEQDLLREQITRLQQEIGGLVARQQGLFDRTREIDSLRDQEGRLELEPRQSLIGLSREQRSLSTETGAAADKLSESPAFELALRGASREMLRASNALDGHDTGVAAQQAQNAALNRLKQLLEALKPSPQEPAPEQPEGQGGAGQNGPPPAAKTQALAELKLLKLLQLEVNRRTIELEEVRTGGKSLSDEQLAQLAELAREQGRLADLIAKLAPTAPLENPEDDPDSLPKLEKPKSEPPPGKPEIPE